MSDPNAISASACAAFHKAVPQLLVFTNEKFKLDSTYAAQGAGTVNPDRIEEFNRGLAGLLGGVYACSLFGNLEGEFIRLAGVLTAHGAGRPVIEAGLKAWIMALQTLVKRPESSELTAPLVSLLQGLGSLWARAEVAPPPLEGDALVLHDLLIERKRKAAAENVLSLLRGGASIEQAYQRALLPALLSIQLKQRQGALSAAQEQAAADICRYIMYRVLDSIVNEQQVPFRVLAACMPGEQDLLGSELFANYLEVRGWQVLFMRESHTLDEIVQAAASSRPHIVLISAGSIQSLPPALELTKLIETACPGIRIACEGRAALLARGSLEDRAEAFIMGFERGHLALLELLNGRHKPHAGHTDTADLSGRQLSSDTQ